jgi:hypothetical protein
VGRVSWNHFRIQRASGTIAKQAIIGSINLSPDCRMNVCRGNAVLLVKHRDSTH